MQEKIDKIYRLVIVLIVIVSIDLLLNITSSINFSSSNTSNSSEKTEAASGYDVSAFKAVSLSGLLDLFKDTKSNSVVYLGRSTCSACVSFLPTLKKMQTKYDYTTYYLDITTVSSGSSEYEDLMSKLSKEVTLVINGESKTDKYGTFFGYTPMTFIISNGKFKDGIVGAYSETRFEEFLNNNGIK